MAPVVRAVAIACLLAVPAAGLVNELFSNNAVCRKNYCINPVFPALEELPLLEEATWECSTHADVREYLSFCQAPVIYQPSLPSPSAGKVSVASLVQKQEDAAATSYFYHLSAMGLEPWEYKEPWKPGTSDCVAAVHRMVCFTFFPRAPAGCAKGSKSKYMRPCASTCGNYLKSCNVECCDNSAQCVFTHTEKRPGTNVSLLQTGYVSQTGPSAYCTGAAGGRGPLRALLLALLVVQVAASGLGSPLPALRALLPGGSRIALGMLLAVLAGSLQGCTVDVPMHPVANWRQAVNYILAYEFIPVGGTPVQAKINSCNTNNPGNLVETGKSIVVNQCSGHGYCMPYADPSLRVTLAGTAPLNFCVCDPEWADPECRTARKSQTTAWLLSIFFGYLGFDQFYLGFPYFGVFKLVTLGGLGFWWVFDVVRIGSSPVYALNYRVSQDLSHSMFVCTLFLILMVVGFALALLSVVWARWAKRREAAQMLQKMDWSDWTPPKPNLVRFPYPYGAAETQGMQ